MESSVLSISLKAYIVKLECGDVSRPPQAGKSIIGNGLRSLHFKYTVRSILFCYHFQCGSVDIVLYYV